MRPAATTKINLNADTSCAQDAVIRLILGLRAGEGGLVGSAEQVLGVCRRNEKKP